ncbi:MAG: hypothetical protein M4D80_41115 [Myxococcota bacterium]|nr:hypothetical protein [Myxococcota bacterium]
MFRTSLVFALALAGCAPSSPNTAYTGPQPPRAQPASQSRSRAIVVRGRVPRGKRVDVIVAVQIDQHGRRKRIRVRPAADGSYQMHLPPGHRYAMAYESQGRRVGNVSFPSAGGRQTHVINVSQNVVLNQAYVDLGEPTYVGGVFVAAYDPEAYLDSDADGVADAHDPDDVDDDQDLAMLDAGVFEGDFEEVIDDGTAVDDDQGGYDDGGHDGDQQHDD